jgi:endonuclease I
VPLDKKSNHINIGTMRKGSQSVGLVALLLRARYTVAQPFSDCSIDAYYSSIDINDRSALHGLIESTHRKVLPYTSSNPDVWDALIGLDGRDTTGDGVVDEVLLLYSDIYVTAQDYGSSTTWNREHIWPKSLGVGTGGPDFTDVHHLRPANSIVNAARGNKLFGACGIVDDVQDCVSPAHAKAASDTETDNVVWLPPANRRGDVARALFYMDIRYDGGNGELDLVLTDCPSSENEMGYLSQLLAWHQEDPVDDAESTRNNAVCASWQGNRNPFIDHPQLVSVYFGDARVPNPPLGYTCNDSSTPNVTATEPPSPPPVTTDGTCNGNGLQPGSVMVTAFNSDDPDVVVLLVLSDLAPGATFYMTDNAWTGTTFRTNEGTLKVQCILV